MYQYNTVTKNLGAFSSTVLSGLSPASNCHFRIQFEYAADNLWEQLDICKSTYRFYEVVNCQCMFVSTHNYRQWCLLFSNVKSNAHVALMIL